LRIPLLYSTEKVVPKANDERRLAVIATFKPDSDVVTVSAAVDTRTDGGMESPIDLKGSPTSEISTYGE
jgi:hypothetical protein